MRYNNLKSINLYVHESWVLFIFIIDLLEEELNMGEGAKPLESIILHLSS